MRWLALLFVTFAAPLQQGGETPIVGPPSISYETVLHVLQLRPASPLIPYAQDIWAASQAATIDVGFALAIWLKESEFGTTGAATTTRNMGNLICEAADPFVRSGCSGRWAAYASWTDAIGDWFAYINRRYVAQGLTTVEAIMPVYAPPVENDTALYIDQVTGWMRDWGSGTVGTAPAGSGLTILEPIMDDWVQRPIDELKYWFWRGLASLLWGDNQAGLGLSDMLARFQRVLVTEGFVPAIELVAEGMLGISVPVFTLGLTLFCLILLLMPAMRLNHWVSGRKVIVLILIVPLLFGAAGSLFQQLEQLRLDIGSVIYSGVFASGDEHFSSLGRPATTSGETLSVCPLAPFNPAVSDALHADAITAAYLCADYEDVMDPDAAPPSDIPDEFAREFFLLDSVKFGDADAAQRETQLTRSAAGVGRMVYGHVLVLLALTEQATNVLWTLGLGTLFVSLLMVLLFSWFRPYEHLTTVLCYRILQVFSTSWIMSAIFGLIMAVLFQIAEGMYAPLVFGAGLGVLLLSLVFLWIAGKTVFGAFGAAWDALTAGYGETASGSGAFAAGTLLGGTLASGRTLQRFGRDLRNRPTVRDGLQNLADARIGYRMATGAGNSSDYALGYALSQYRPLAQLGALAAAMGTTSHEFLDGLYTGHRYTNGAGDLLNPHAQRIVHEDGMQAIAQRRRATHRLNQPRPSSPPPAGPSGGSPPPGGGTP